MKSLFDIKIIGKKLNARDYRQYFFELLLLVMILSAYLGISDLSGLDHRKAVAIVGVKDFALIGAPAVYGIRISSFIAIARQYRMPQTLEWLAFIIPLLLYVTMVIASGPLTMLYAQSHGYRLCGRQQDDFSAFVFALPEAPCPAGLDSH